MEAFKTLFNRYYKKLYHFSLGLLKSREDAEEMVHDVFVKVWENRTNLKEALSFNAYLLTIARNRIYNQLRQKQYEKSYKKYQQE